MSVPKRLSRWPVPSAWAEPIAEWELFLLAGGRSSSTVFGRTQHIRTFARACRVTPEQVTEQMILQWSGAKKWKPETRHSYYVSFRSFFGFWSKRIGFADPAAGLPSVRRIIPPPRPAPDAVVLKALSEIPPREALVLRLAAVMGLRCTEIAKVSAPDLIEDLFGPALVVHGKGGKTRIVPVPAHLYGDLVAGFKRNGFWLFPGNEDGHLSARWISKLGGWCLPQGWTMHTLRHRFATKAYRTDHDLVAVQRLLGHASIETTQRYVEPVNNAMRRAVEGAQ